MNIFAKIIPDSTLPQAGEKRSRTRKWRKDQQRSEHANNATARLSKEQMSGRWWARAHFAKKGHVTEMLMSRLPNPWLQKGEILWILCKGRFLVTHSCWPFHLKFGIELRTKSIVPFVRACPVLCTFFSLFSIQHPERLVASFYSVLDILVAEMRFHERTLAF